jgi:hypothetical protein
VRQSGKNSADIRLVVDALDLCYTKSHVNTFVIISGDSDFSPLVSKLRENAKQVIGVGVKQSTSDLLVANCDEFIFYDDLVREQRRAAAKRDERKAQPQSKRPSDDRRKEELEMRKVQALEMVVETFDALVSERGDSGKIWASLLKDTLKRRRPDFSETYYGFRTFGNLLEEAQTRGLFEFGRDEKSGAYVYRGSAAQVVPALEQAPMVPELTSPELAEAGQAAEAQPEPKSKSRGRGRGGRKQGEREQAQAAAQEVAEQFQAEPAQAAQVEAPAEVEAQAAPEAPAEAATEAPKERRRTPRAPRKTAARKAEAAQAEAPEAAEAVSTAPAAPESMRGEAQPEAAVGGDTEGGDTAAEASANSARKKPARPSHKAPARKAATRARRPAKPKTTEGA